MSVDTGSSTASLEPTGSTFENLKIIFLGIIVHGVLFGILCGQVGWYLRHYFHRDRRHIRCLVLLVLFLNVLHMMFYIITLFYILTTDHAEMVATPSVPWSFSAQLVTNAFGVLAVHLFYLIRIRSFSKQAGVTGVLALFIATTFCLGLLIFLRAVHARLSEILHRVVLAQTVSCAVLAATDILLTTTFVYFLIKSQKGGATRSYRLVKSLTFYTITSGALTCLCALLSLIAILTAPSLVLSLLLSYTGANLYASSFVANLNAREGLRARWAEVSEVSDIDVPTSHEFKRGSPGSPSRSNSRIQRVPTRGVASPESLIFEPEGDIHLEESTLCADLHTTRSYGITDHRSSVSTSSSTYVEGTDRNMA